MNEDYLNLGIVICFIILVLYFSFIYIVWTVASIEIENIVIHNQISVDLIQTKLSSPS